jgi:hypothetical protein
MAMDKQKIKGEYGDWRVLTPYGFCYDFETKEDAVEFTERNNKALKGMGSSLRYTFDGPKRGSDAWWEEKGRDNR